MTRDGPRRRTVLLSSVTALSAGLAGCNGLNEDPEDEDDEGGDTATPGGTTDGTTTATTPSNDLPVDGDPGSLSYGEMAHSRLTADAPSDDAYGGPYEPYVFDGSAGDTVGVGVASLEGETAVYLLDGEGAVLAEDTGSVDGGNAEIRSFELPADGTYVVVAASSGSVPFDYSVSLSAGETAGGDLRSIEVGGVATGRIDESDPEDDDYLGYHEPVTVAASADTALNVRMAADTGNALLLVLDDGGEVLDFDDDGGEGTDASLSRFVVPEDGEYTIVAASLQRGATFEYTLSVQEAGEATDLRSIEVGETATGFVDTTDPREQRYRGYYEPVSLSADAEQTVTIEMNSPGGDTYLFLEDPDGEVVAENDDARSSLNSRIARYQFERGGEYTIVAASYGESETFEYELSVAEAEPPVDLRSIEVGETATGAIDAGDPRDSEYGGNYEPVTLAETDEPAVTVEATSQDGAPALILESPEGERLSTAFSGEPTARLTRVPLDEDGEYTVAVASAGDAVLEYELSVAAAEPPVDLRSIEVGETATGFVDAGDPQDPEYGGNYEPVSFSVDEDQPITVEMSTDEGRPALLLVDGDDEILTTAVSGEPTTRLVRTPVTADESYTIVAASAGTGGQEYQLSVTEAEPPVDLRSIEIGETATGQIDLADPSAEDYRGYYEPVTLAAEGGETVTVEMTSEVGDTYLFLEAPNGEVVAENDDTQASLNSRIEEVTLESAGEYTVVAASYGESETFEYELSVGAV